MCTPNSSTPSSAPGYLRGRSWQLQQLGSSHLSCLHLRARPCRARITLLSRLPNKTWSLGKGTEVCMPAGSVAQLLVLVVV